MVDVLREEFGVEPICRVLEVAPSTYYAVKAREREPSRRARADAELVPEIRRIYEAGKRRYGARKVWWQLQQDGIRVARCTVERLMRGAGLVGVRRGLTRRTTIPHRQPVAGSDLVRRRFQASRPDEL